MSNHRPVQLLVQITPYPVPITQAIYGNGCNTELIAWHKVFGNIHAIQNYQYQLSYLLDDMDYSALLQCTDVKCNNHEHLKAIDKWCYDITQSCVDASTVLPKRHVSSNRRPKAGWTENVRPFQLENKQWHDAWVKNGRPRNGNVYENMIKPGKTICMLCAEIRN